MNGERNYCYHEGGLLEGGVMEGGVEGYVVEGGLVEGGGKRNECLQEIERDYIYIHIGNQVAVTVVAIAWVRRHRQIGRQVGR